MGHIYMSSYIYIPIVNLIHQAYFEILYSKKCVTIMLTIFPTIIAAGDTKML